MRSTAREVTGRRRTGHVRPLETTDIPQIAALHGRVFANGSSPDHLTGYLAQIFCHNPWYDDELPSLVYAEENGRVTGCLGVIPRPLSLGGSAVRAAITHTFMVEPGSSALAALHLLKTFCNGPQDLSITEANPLSRRIWAGVGATTALLYSMRWTRLLRPSAHAVSVLRRRGLPGPLAVALGPVARVVDALAVRIPRSPFHLQTPPALAGELDAHTLLTCLQAFVRNRPLRPEYDERSLTWLLRILLDKATRGRLHQVAVRDGKGSVLGWYLYYLNRKGTSEVVQIGADDRTITPVLDHLFDHAWRHGAVAVSGQLDPAYLEALSDRYSLLHLGGSRVMFHSRRPEIVQAILRGDGFLTRLEGEWWII